MPYLIKSMEKLIYLASQKVESAIFLTIGDLSVRAYVTREPVPFADRLQGRPLELRPGDIWGQLWDCAWFRFQGKLPAGPHALPVVLLIDINGELCLVDRQGRATQGLTCVSSEFDYSLGKPGKRVVRLQDIETEGGVIDLWADGACNDLFGKLQNEGRLREARLAFCQEQMLQLHYDMEVLMDLYRHLPEASARRSEILFALSDAVALLQNWTDEEARQARAVLTPVLGRRGGDPSLKVSAIGHAHIDLAWLWPLRETRRKGVRTVATALLNMDRYPAYHFGASQPQLYQWLQEDQPALFASLKRQVEAGRWELQGAMWVEPDTNLSGGEALVRQLLHGKTYYREHFGHEENMLWLPDVFGYSAALPQLLRKAGVQYFMTIKLSWSRHNTFPHHTFRWQGLDGSEVLAHMPPEGTYNSSALPHAVIKAENSYCDKGVADECLLLFGIGDGGGGPGEEHLERLERERNLSGICPVTQGPARAFFERLESRRGRYPVWRGELYLECHQGTYTSQARSKKYNRKLELALRDLEMTACLLGSHLPAAELKSIWQRLLLYQFHDILPGSSIDRVYDESVADYQDMLGRVHGWLAEMAGGERVRPEDAAGCQEILAVNTLSWPRRVWLATGEGDWQSVTLQPLSYQIMPGNNPALFGHSGQDRSAYGQSVQARSGQDMPGLDMPADRQALAALRYTEDELDNGYLRVRFAADGTLASVYDWRANREVLDSSCPGNQLILYDDDPDLGSDAWDFPEGYRSRPSSQAELIRTESYRAGPAVCRRQVMKIGQSLLEQVIVLTAGSARLDFITEADWQEDGRMLRTSFTAAVQASQATCDIQFGSISRPTHRNTLWDEARYEVPVHKFVDLSEPGYGVALLNDCKYGHRLSGSVIDLNLLRATSFPGRTADRGRHQFTYALFPHMGDVHAGAVRQAAYELNIEPLLYACQPDPVRTTPLPGIHVNTSLISVSDPAVVVETIKPAEDGQGIIVRLYESQGARTHVRIEPGFACRSITLVDLLEQPSANIDAAAWEEAEQMLLFRPFEIHTLRLLP